MTTHAFNENLKAIPTRILLIFLLFSQAVWLARADETGAPGTAKPANQNPSTKTAQSGSNFTAGNGMGMIWVAPVNGWVGKYMVTQAEYQKIMGTNPSYFKGPRHPVEQVTWNEAVDYCKKLTEQDHASGILPARYQYNLPTYAQYDIFVGDAGTDDAAAMLNQQQPNFTADVGMKKSNQYGLHDTRGLFWQWCLDSSKAVNSNEGGKGLRGGTVPHSPDIIPVSSSVSGKTDYHNWLYGFRVVVSVESTPSPSKTPGKKGK